MSPFRFALAAVLPLTLAACGVPDLIAHGVKSMDRNQNGNRTAAGNPYPAAQPAPAAAPQRAPDPEPEYGPAAAPVRESITSEPLR